MAAAPVFVGTPKIWQAQISAANTGRDGTGTVVTVTEDAASGHRIDRIRLVAVGTTTAGVVRLYMHDGTVYRLFREVLVSAVTPSATVEVWWTELLFPDGLTLPDNWTLRAAPHNAETFNVFAWGGLF